MIIRFDRRLYRPQAVEAAAEAFKDLASISVRAAADWIEAHVDGDRAELDDACGGDFEGEFANQALSEAAA